MMVALLLAQMCVAEIAFSRDMDECRLMWHIMAAKDGDLSYNVRHYNSLFKTKNPKRRYILHLNAEASQPLYWPRLKMRWDVYIDRWLDVHAAAVKFVAHPGKHPCPAAVHYGAPVDGKGLDDHVPSHWVELWCGRLPTYDAMGRIIKRPWNQSYYRIGSRTLPARVAAGQ